MRSVSETDLTSRVRSTTTPNKHAPNNGTELFFLVTRALVSEDSYTSAPTRRRRQQTGVPPERINLAEEQNPWTPKSSHIRIWKN